MSRPTIRDLLIVTVTALLSGVAVYGVRWARHSDGSPVAAPAPVPAASDVAVEQGQAAGEVLRRSLVAQSTAFKVPIMAAPVFKPRPADEWQGMLVDQVRQPECDTTARCSLALACVQGKCGACRGDSDCLGGESCVFDHCIRSEHVQCRGRRDCGPKTLCVLTEYGYDARGNEGMRAHCNPTSGGQQQDEKMAVLKPDEKFGAKREGPVNLESLRASLND